jgi:hypothetical protein
MAVKQGIGWGPVLGARPAERGREGASGPGCRLMRGAAVDEPRQPTTAERGRGIHRSKKQGTAWGEGVRLG